ncbi:hypothetical protein G3I01_09635 [Gramella sp. MT6]|uniref:hypothetical protein n=1 Tax=Gramella sp. MT6 TaxID=2705471 RepID=UPI001C5FA326|nr:hypothetical protein [Gramella sp. MT6]QYA25756.1 hypothetical protein G3I01_09635 [Gramella sp. MT6]
MKKTDVYIWCLGAFLCAYTFQSCSVDDPISAESKLTDTAPLSENYNKNSFVYTKPEPISYAVSEIFSDEIYAADCQMTDFGEVLQEYFDTLISDPLFDFELINYYADLNRRYVTYYIGDNYYGANGEYDKLAKKRIRELTKFWSLDREITLNGLHTATLNDRETLTDMIESFDRTVRNRDEAYEKADALLELNAQTGNIPENPYFALDAFTRSNGLLVIGDGLLESLIAIGIDGDIAFTSILSHEWWHQAQFENDEDWDYMDQLDSAAERSRFFELEADFAAAYYMTHKRGATYNWKRIEDYFRLSYNVGDCLTFSDHHHGTPEQRLAAARLAYELAESSQKKGFILSPEEVHQYFIEYYETMVL